MEKIKLIEKYNAGTLTQEEMKSFQRMVEEGEIRLEEISSLQDLKLKMDSIKIPETSEKLDARFYSMLAAKSKANKKAEVLTWSQVSHTIFNTIIGRVSFGVVLIAVGFIVGMPTKTDELNQLTSEVREMREMMVLNMIEEESPGKRLKAVGLTGEILDAGTVIIDALFKTLNTDNNSNVRLAAIDALVPYSSIPKVRERLVESIKFQKEPLVLLRMAEVMSALQEKSSVKEFNEALDKSDLPTEFKDEVKKNINTII